MTCVEPSQWLIITHNIQINTCPVDKKLKSVRPPCDKDTLIESTMFHFMNKSGFYRIELLLLICMHPSTFHLNLLFKRYCAKLL